ncbi:PhzF family phenazine biosynthesis protein [Actinopolyspora saharensis]|uniref:Trans-2,3-dihydro-3-hydroxyanthranilate isomerase n=1 Tax=Actinopolyspora saharensis TaxID=995062 RepID=A0A1H1FAX1_9ACTN|nr:PhzF family phenazine biosynthesis isomerase [Actinopolyspora saharensis]SDQ98067.1 trans-2,3-dihydro-3-hydroxyanthranilate isomerase [Actinopolyspora saharensis]
MREYMVVDAFARTPLQGNPVAVFFDSSDLSSHSMQCIAKEMNLSEVTFVLPPEGKADARIRIFTPVNELPFAGHPMLGTAVALASTIPREQLRLETAMGVIPCQVASDGTDEALSVRMRQPVPVREPYEHAAELCAALGTSSSTVPVEVYRNGPRHAFVGLDSIAELSALRPDHKALTAFPDLAVNCFAGSEKQWRTRMFSPAYGVVEDAATGSAAGPLAVHLARHGLVSHDQEIEILQGVEMGRSSLMLAAAEGADQRLEAVHVGGHGVPVAWGRFHV